jgi:hypothetical protein
VVAEKDTEEVNSSRFSETQKKLLYDDYFLLSFLGETHYHMRQQNNRVST